MIKNAIYLIILTLILLFFIAPLALLSLPFKRKKRFQIIYFGWSFGLWVTNTLILRMHVTYEDRVPNHDFFSRGLYISNHSSMADIPLINYYYPVPSLMKQELVNIPIFGKIAKLSGCVPVKRKDPSSRQKALFICQKILLRNFPLLFYPEGTRSLKEGPKPYKNIYATLLYFAYDNNIPVYPITIYGTKEIITRDGHIRPKQPVGLLGHPKVLPQNFSDKKAFAQFCWNEVISGYTYLKNKIGSQTASQQEEPT